ncbi:MAG: HEPN domain-containing protein [Saprospiraceae bacterium]
MTDATKSILSRAKEALETAKFSLEKGYYVSTINRSYYAAFYCVQVFLNQERIFVKTHNGANAKFAEYFVRTDKVDINYLRTFSYLGKIREDYDYDYDKEANEAVALSAINKSIAFYDFTVTYFAE